MPDQHVGVRRRQARFPVRRVVPLVVGLAMVAWALALGEPARDTGEAGQDGTLVTGPSAYQAPGTVDLPGFLADGSTYQPYLFLDGQTSVGAVIAPDRTVRAVAVAQAPGTVTTLHERPPGESGQVSGFAVEGDTVVWMESTVHNNTTSATLWRASLSGQSEPAPLTTDVGQLSFRGVQSGVVIGDGNANWTSLYSENPSQTAIKEVPLNGGPSETWYLSGEFLFTSTWPWVVSALGGVGSPVTLINTTTDQIVNVPAAANELVVCNPQWCRAQVFDDAGQIGIDLMRPDGSDRHRIVGAQGVPAIREPALIDRYAPYAVQTAEGLELHVFDLAEGESRLIAAPASNFAGRGNILWWSTGQGVDLTWHALDLSTPA